MPDLASAPLHDYSQSRAVMIGTWDYDHLPPVPAAANSLDRMVSLLNGPLCGWPEDRLLVVRNERSLGDLPDQLITAFEDITGIAVFYYVGHGQIDLDDQLCLSLVASRTEANRRAATSLPFQAVRRALLDSPAATKIVILDCCFAGLANRPANTLAALPDDVLDKASGAGAYTMAASGAYTTAWFEAGADIARPQTFFTKYLADIVETGIPGEAPGLRLHPLFIRVRDSLSSDRRPVPSERTVDAARDFVFARNAAPPETHQDPVAQLRFLTQRLSEAEASRVQENAEANAQEKALRARAAELTKELARLKDQARHIQSMNAPQQRELRDAIDEIGRRLEETTAAQGRAKAVGAEQDRVAGFGRLEDGFRQAGDWYRWGPYVSERQWGTVREDYSASGDAWNFLSHDQARSRAYRWGEDGLAGFCDIHQRLCLGLALWNGADPVLKERLFGLTSRQGNHGEDVKEYWWYLDAVPSHAWNRWRYHYPQGPFPYKDLIDQNAARTRLQPEYELIDTGVFDDDRYWIVEMAYAKAGPDDLLMAISVTNAGPDAETLHVLPTSWFRNTWSWEVDLPKPIMEATGDTSARIEHPFLGPLELLAGSAPDGSAPTLLFCENETNVSLLYAAPPVTPYPKDGINDHVIHGAATVNPDRRGTKCAFWYKLEVPPGGTAELRLRLRPSGTKPKAAAALGQQFERVVAARRAEADEFYAQLTPERASADEAAVMRQAFSGMLWSKQFYKYDVGRWLAGDPTQPSPPAQRLIGRNSTWRHLDSFDIISVPDKWEYPWFAAWGLAFQCVALAHLDPAFAKYQLTLLCGERFQHPNGALPAYEWDFGDASAPVQAWAALEVFAIDGGRDLDFLSRIFDKLLINFTWWINREDADGNNVFQGGYLGLDNIGPIDRRYLSAGAILQQCDARGWIGFYAVGMASIAAILYRSGRRSASDMVLKFLNHFAAIADAIDSYGGWDDQDGFYYDLLLTPDGAEEPVKGRSMVVMIPMLAVALIDERILQRWLAVGAGADFLQRRGLDDQEKMQPIGMLRGEPGHQQMLLSMVGMDRLEKLLARLFDEAEFLSPYGLRALSAYHRDHPYTLHISGTSTTIDYEPAESTTPDFGGNSNWRGPLWFPLNYLVVSSLDRYHRFVGDEFTLEYPAGSGRRLPLDAISADLQDRLISIFLVGPDGRRPCFGGAERLQNDPAWKDNILFSEYFHGDSAAGLGASHQTGWTGIVADLIRRRHG